MEFIPFFANGHYKKTGKFLRECIISAFFPLFADRSTYPFHVDCTYTPACGTAGAHMTPAIIRYYVTVTLSLSSRAGPALSPFHPQRPFIHTRDAIKRDKADATQCTVSVDKSSP